MFFAVNRSQLLPHGGNATSLSSLGAEVRCRLDAARRICEVRRSDEADSDWSCIYEYVETRDEPGLLGALTARASAHMLRLSLVYALLDGSRTIQPEHVAAAYALWRYSDASCRILFAESTGSTTADRISEALDVAGDEGLDRTAISALFSGHTSAAEITAALGMLKDSGRACEVKQPTNGGRPPLRYFTTRETSEQSERRSGLPPLLSLLAQRAARAHEFEYQLIGGTT